MNKNRTDNQHDAHGELQANQADAESLAFLRGAEGAFQGKSGIERGGEQGRIEAGQHRNEQGDTDGQSRNTQVLAEVQRCVNQRSQGGLSEQRNHGHRQSKSDNDHQHRLAHRRHHQLEAAAAQYLACVDTPQTQRHHREEEVNVIDESNEHHENGNDKQGDGRGAIARLARMPDIIGKVVVGQ